MEVSQVLVMCATAGPDAALFPRFGPPLVRRRGVRRWLAATIIYIGTERYPLPHGVPKHACQRHFVNRLKILLALSRNTVFF